jgi:cell division protein ZipA
MDADVFRILLVAAGVSALAAIYLWDRQKRKRRSSKRQREVPGASLGDGISMDSRDNPDESLAEELDDLGRALTENRKVPAMERGDASQSAAPAATPPPARAAATQPRSTPSTAKPAPEAQRRQRPAPKIVLVSVAAGSGRTFAAQDIHATMRSLGLFYVDMGIFQRHENDTTDGALLFSVASMVEPGSIPSDEDTAFVTPGLTFFTQLPGSKEDVNMFDNMLFSAERTARNLGGELQDSQRSTLTPQTIRHLREEVLEHSRKCGVERMRQ